MKSLRLATSDEVNIATDFYVASGDRFAVLIHMMPATKESWGDFANALQKNGIASIAFDQRGHGESDGGPIGYKEFTDAEQQAKRLDLEATFRELQRRGAVLEKTVIVGASIGANLTIDYLGKHPECKVGVALSPGLDYRGIMADDAVKKLNEDQHLMIVASDEDAYSFQSIKKLYELQPKLILVEKSGLGHGTDMFVKDPQFMQNVVTWIDEQL